MPHKPNILLVHGAWGDASHWRHIIPPLHEKGYRVFAVQNPLISLSDDVDVTSRLTAAQDAPTLLVGHAYGCAVITGAGLMPNVVGLVYLAGPALDEGESLKSLWARRAPPEGAVNIRQDKYGFLWIEPEKFHETFCHDLEDKTESLVWALTQKPTAGVLFRREVGSTGMEAKAQLVSDLSQRPVDSYGDGKVDGRANQGKKEYYFANESCFRGNSPR